MDFFKAYYKVSWEFIFKTLKKLGLEFFYQMIKISFQCATTIVGMNRAIIKYFLIERIVKKGYSLTPYPFILVDKILNIIIQNVVQQHYL